MTEIGDCPQNCSFTFFAYFSKNKLASSVYAIAIFNLKLSVTHPLIDSLTHSLADMLSHLKSKLNIQADRQPPLPDRKHL